MRSDVPLVTRNLQDRVLKAFFFGDPGWVDAKQSRVDLPPFDAQRMIDEVVRPEFERAIGGKLELDEIVIGKGLSRDVEKYKARSVHVKLAERIKAEGHEYFVGMKVEYVITQSRGNLDGVLRQEYLDDPEATYDAEYYWDRVIFPASRRVLEVMYPEVDWSRFEVRKNQRRAKLVAQLKRWLLDRKKHVKARERIRSERESGRLLGPEELAELARVPRIRLLASKDPS